MKQVFFFLYQLIIWLPLFFTSTVLAAFFTTVGCSLGGDRIFSHYPGMWWSKFICIITLSPVKIVGREKLDKKQSYIFVANHQGIYDIFLMYGYLGHSIKWVMKQSLRKLPFVGKACETAGFIFVDNSSPKATIKTLRDAEQCLRNGASIAIFPEGSRSKDGKLAPFKKGAYQMALDLKLPIVPVSINGSYDVMSIHTYFIRPHKMELIIHDPIPTENLPLENLRETATGIRRLLDESKKEIESALWEKYQTK
jgi:1-acyl-sn-glycerol-3-phosphate acyltransferase